MFKHKVRKEDISELLTLKQASEILKVHPNTLRSWDKKGILKAVHLGLKRARRYRVEDIKRLVDSKK